MIRLLIRTRSFLAAALASAALAGCQSFQESKLDVAVAALPEPAPSTASGTCDILGSRDWASFNDQTPQPGREPGVRITGKVDVRSGGYTFAWQWGPHDLMGEPAALTLNLLMKMPEGIATMAITTEEVTYEGPALPPGYIVLIRCGQTTLAEISELRELLRELEPAQDAG